jgi:hypothetical protein
VNFIEKIARIKESYPNLIVFVSFSAKAVDLSAIDQLKDIYPFLPPDYIRFLESIRGIRISWCTFLSASDWEIISREEINNIWSSELENRLNCPIGVDAAGDLFCLNKNGNVVMFDVEKHGSPPILIANSFNEFMNNCVLGKRYPEFAFIEGNKFYDFLNEQGWA